MPLLQVLRGETLTPPPIWFMRQAGRYLPEYRAVREKAGNFLKLCYSPELAFEVSMQPVRRFPLDAAIVFSDILLIPDVLGQEVAFSEGEGPVLSPLVDEKDINKLQLCQSPDKLEPVYETIRRLRKALPERVALIGFAGAPWTLAAYMIEGRSSKDFGRAKRWSEKNVASFSKLMEILVASISDHLIRQVAAGADVVQLFDSWAGVLAEPAFERWVVEPTRLIVQNLRKACPETPIIGFPRGAGESYRLYAERSGVDGIGVDQSVSPKWAAAELQTKVCVQGNLDPAALVEGGARLRMEAASILAALSHGPFVFNLGHGVVPETPPEHVAALLDLVRQTG